MRDFNEEWMEKTWAEREELEMKRAQDRHRDRIKRLKRKAGREKNLYQRRQKVRW